MYLYEKIYPSGMQYALITGATSGIGLCYAEQIAERGYNIIVVSNQAEQNEVVAKRLRHTYGVEAIAIYADLTRDDAAESLFAECQQRGFEVEILINNAGMLLFSQMHNTSPEALRRIVALHCTTPTLLCRLFGGAMAERGRGHILLMSSITAWTPYPTISHYAATKAYLKNFGESIWWEMRRRGVGVTTVFPSAVDTPFYNLSDKMRRRLLWWGAMMKPDDVARRGLRAMFKRRRKCLPGVLTTIEAAVCAALPAWVLRPILKISAIKRILEKV